MRRFRLFALILGIAAAPAFAHHSFAMFSMDKNLTVMGTVTEFSWTNPHSFMHLDIADTAGATTNWAIEMTSPNNLLNGGWRRSSLKPGDKVMVTYHPLVNGRPGGALVSVKLPDGRVLENK